jgi:hypothetical protein
MLHAENGLSATELGKCPAPTFSKTPRKTDDIPQNRLLAPIPDFLPEK